MNLCVSVNGADQCWSVAENASCSRCCNGGVGRSCRSAQRWWWFESGSRASNGSVLMVNVAGAALVVTGPNGVVVVTEHRLLLRCRNSRSRWCCWAWRGGFHGGWPWLWFVVGGAVANNEHMQIWFAHGTCSSMVHMHGRRWLWLLRFAGEDSWWARKLRVSAAETHGGDGWRRCSCVRVRGRWWHWYVLVAGEMALLR